jgi:hypothetical protein
MPVMCEMCHSWNCEDNNDPKERMCKYILVDDLIEAGLPYEIAHKIVAMAYPHLSLKFQVQ